MLPALRIATLTLDRPVLLYDGECRLCRFAARCVVRLDRRHELAFLRLQDHAATPLLAALVEDELLDTWRLVHPDGSLAGYGAGVPALLESMHVTRAIGRLLGRAPDRALDRIYRLIAHNRGVLGRLLPDGSAPRRFP